MGEHFVGDDGGVGVDVAGFYGEGGDFCDEDAAEGVGDAGVEADDLFDLGADLVGLGGGEVNLVDDGY